MFSETPEEHFRQLQKIFYSLRKHGLKIKLPKCQFVKDKTKYLGFVKSKTGIKPDLDKVEVISPIPELKTVRELRGFIGAMGYYRHFFSAFSRTLDSLDEEVC